MVPVTRKILLCGRALSPAEQGPLRYSGDTIVHPDAKVGHAVEGWSVAFWLWIPPEQTRCKWAGVSMVTPLLEHEREMLANGELEELRITALTPPLLPKPEFARWLGESWRERQEQRVGFLHPQFSSVGQPAATPTALRLLQERESLVVTR